MPRYVILYHQTPPSQGRPSHWDLMLETDRGLLTWALETPPEPGQRIAAERLPIHRPAYLDYEGPVSGNRGSVVRWDVGEYEGETEQGLELSVRVIGQRLHGLLTVVTSSAGVDCRVCYEPDAAGLVSPDR